MQARTVDVAVDRADDGEYVEQTIPGDTRKYGAISDE